MQVSRSDAGGGVDGSVGVRVGAPLRFQGDLHTAEGDHKVTTLRNLDEDKLPATEKPRGVSCLQVSRDDTGGGTRRTRSFDVPHEEGRGPEGWGPQGPTDWVTPARAAWGPEGWGPEASAQVGEKRDLPGDPEGPLRSPREISRDRETTGGVPKGNPKGNRTTIVHGKPHSSASADVAWPCSQPCSPQQVRTRTCGPSVGPTRQRRGDRTRITSPGGRRWHGRWGSGTGSWARKRHGTPPCPSVSGKTNHRTVHSSGFSLK